MAGYVQAYGARPFFTVEVEGTTNASGITNFTVEGNTEDAGGNPLSTIARQPFYLSPDVSGYNNIFVSTEIFNMPIQLFVELEADTPIVELTGTSTVTLTATVTDEYGDSMEGLTVGFTSIAGTLSSEEGTTNSEGKATVTFTPSIEYGEMFAVSDVSASVSEIGYGAGSATFMVLTYNARPAFSEISLPQTGFKTENTTLTITGKVTDPNGISSLNISLDSGSPVSITPATDGSFSHTLQNLSVGSHTVVLATMDGNGVSNSYEATFSVKEKEEEKEEEFPMALLILIIVIVIIIIVIVVAMMKRGGKPKGIEPEPEKELEEEPIEEPVEEPEESETPPSE